MVLMFCGLADGLQNMVIYRQADVLRMVFGWCVVHVVEMQTKRARAKRGLSADGTDGARTERRKEEMRR